MVESISKGKLIKVFFIRRILRIFPIYYLVIAGVFILGPSTGTNIRSDILYYITYVTNLHFFYSQNWDGMLSHLWSLAVEEQFYLLWPWLMVFLHRKLVLPFIIASILTGLTAQFLLKDIMLGDILTVSCFDGLGLGALLAWVYVNKPDLIRAHYLTLFFLAIGCTILQVVRVTGTGPYILPSRTLTAVCTVWAICGIILNKESKSTLYNLILNNKPLIFIGKLSYGIYLYHLLLPHFTNKTFTFLNSHLPASVFRYNLYLLSAEKFCLLLFVSYVSWKLIEQPILSLKKHFQYQKDVPAMMSPVKADAPPSQVGAVPAK